MSKPELKNDRPGSVRQFLPSDVDTAVHAWKNIGGDSLVNQRGWAAIHIVVQRLAAGQASPKDLYDQVLIVENPGAVVVCTSGYKVGMVQNFRFTGDRILSDSGYVKKLAEENRWEELLGTLGSYRWELPRGLAPQCAGDDPTKFIVAAAKMEAAEECGFQIANARIAAMLNPNSTFFAHAQYVLAADFVRKEESQLEEHEMLGAVQLFSKEEVNELIANGELTDGLTLAALRIVGF